MRMSFLRPRNIITALGVGIVMWLAGCAVIYSEMRKPPEEFGRFMKTMPAPIIFLMFPFEKLWAHARAGTLEVGDPAPDFDLVKTDKSGSVRLGALAEKQPVVVVFGSYT